MTRNMKIILVVLGLSLAFNVFTLGHTIGRGLHGRHHDDRPPMMGPVEFNLRAIHKLLPDEAKSRLKEALRENRTAMRETFKGFRQNQKNLKAILSAETFDSAAFEAELEHHDAAMKALHDPLRDALLDVLPTLDQPTRAKLADILFSRRMPRKMKPHDDDDDMPPPPPPGDMDGPGPDGDDGPPED